MLNARLLSIKVVLLLIFTSSANAEIPSSDRIFGGNLARPGQIPYIATLLQVQPTPNGTIAVLSCAGSIISDRWIVSAAHCTLGPSPHKNIRILIGVVNLITDGDVYAVQEVVNHPDYDPYTLINDICLIRLVEALEWNEKLRPISLGSHFIDGGVRAKTSGWGLTEVCMTSFLVDSIDVANSMYLLAWPNLYGPPLRASVHNVDG